MTLDFEQRFRNKSCSLCNKVTSERVHYMVGGFIQFAHDSCLEIVRRYVKLLEKHNANLKLIHKAAQSEQGEKR